MVVFSVGTLTLRPAYRMGMNRKVLALGAVLIAVVLLAALLYPPVWLVDSDDYDGATVTIVDTNGTRLASVDVRVADTSNERRIGLMRTDSLANGSGMLFVHPKEAQYTYHMRNMDFDIDIIFVGESGTVTTIHHANAPDSGESSDTFSGRGKYVLEVPRGYANATDIAVDDRIRVPDSIS